MFPIPTINKTHDGSEYDRQPLDNTSVKQFLNEINAFEYNELPRWIDDCFAGACGQLDNTARIHPARIYGLCRSLDGIDSGSVARAMNRKRLALGDAPYSNRYCQKIAAACRCASQAIEHHKAFYHVEPIGKQIKEYKPLPYNDDEMKEIKRLSLISFKELTEYENGLKQKYGI